MRWGRHLFPTREEMQRPPVSPPRGPLGRTQEFSDVDFLADGCSDLCSERTQAFGQHPCMVMPASQEALSLLPTPSAFCAQVFIFYIWVGGNHTDVGSSSIECLDSLLVKSQRRCSICKYIVLGVIRQVNCPCPPACCNN